MAEFIHRFWMGREMPEAYKEYGRQWAALNPAYQVIEWNESHLRDFGKWFPHCQDALSVILHLYARDANRNGIELAVQVADVMGYVVTFEYGGVYVNCDMQPLRKLPELPDKAWASYENNEDGRIVNAAIGAPEKWNSFWAEVLGELPGRYFANPTDEMVMTTGPGLLTDIARQHRDKIHVFPVETFNPIHWKQISPGSDASSYVNSANWLDSTTIAVHHWGHKKDGRSNVVETATQ